MRLTMRPSSLVHQVQQPGMKSRRRQIAAAAVLLLAVVRPAAAHHSFSAEFDANRLVTLDGEVVMMEWVNPHSWLHIDVKKPDGSVERWKIEGGSPSVLFRLGWNRDSLPAGTKITVVGFQAKTDRCAPARASCASPTAAAWISAARDRRR